jgi:hypothetical protein
MDTDGIIDSQVPSGSHKILQFEGRNSNICPKLPYDSADISVKRINAFRIGDIGHSKTSNLEATNEK